MVKNSRGVGVRLLGRRASSHEGPATSAAALGVTGDGQRV